MTHHAHQPLEGKRAAVMIGPMFEDVEATYPYHRLREAGATVELIGIKAEETVRGKKGEELRVENAAADLVADDLDLLVIAGDLRNAGAEWEDAEVVVDGNLVSSRRPDDLPAFMRALIEVAVGAEEAVAAS